VDISASKAVVLTMICPREKTHVQVMIGEDGKIL